MATGSKIKTFLFLILRLALAGVFIYAGVMKVIDTPQFAIDIFNFRLLPWDAAVVMAIYLPWLEIISGLLILLRWKWYPGALAILGGLLVIFLLALASAWWREIDISCGCFGAKAGKAKIPELIIRDILLLAMTGLLFLKDKCRS